MDDMVLNLDNTRIAYVVVGTGGSLDLGARLMPVPLSAIQWDAANGAFVINANPATFRDAPFFTDGQYPDSTTSGWNSEFDAFWQNVVTP